jgi:hypothetical protein
MGPPRQGAATGVRRDGKETDDMVVFAADYPFLDIFWTMIIFFAWVSWFWIAITVLSDVFRRHDISGWAKAAWVVFVIILPFLGVLLYLISNSKEMAERSQQQVSAARAQYESAGAAAEIDKAKQLLDSGAITQEEYGALKAKALA